MKLFVQSLVITAVVLVSTPAYSDNGKRLENAAHAFANKNETSAAKSLDEIEMTSPLFQHSFLEQQKQHYRQGKWEKFFGYATYYRKELMVNFLEPDLLLLEVMALVRHCQFKAAAKISEFSKRLIAHGKNTEAITDEESALFNKRIKSVDSLLAMHLKHQDTVPTIAVKNKFSAFSRMPEWKIRKGNSSAVLKRAVRHPRVVRVYVKNKCEKGDKK